MKRFYLLRHEDLHGHAGLGVVAEGVIHGDGTGSFTWLTSRKTITAFLRITDIKELHEHGGRTEIVIENPKSKKLMEKFEMCQSQARDKWHEMKQKRKAKKDKNETD